MFEGRVDFDRIVMVSYDFVKENNELLKEYLKIPEKLDHVAHHFGHCVASFYSYPMNGTTK